MFEFSSTMDLISHVLSNSLFIFCFCNLIILTILVSSKPISNKTKGERESQSSPSQVNYNHKNNTKVTRGQNKAEADPDHRGNDEDNHYGSDDKDELRKRVEEFIEKANKGWKAE